MINKGNLIGIAKLRINVASLMLSFAALFTASTFAQIVHYPQDFSFTPGWNLAGNSLNTPIDVKAIFGKQTNIQTVWKWNAAGSTWAFYAPSLDTAGTLGGYAATRGYSVLTTLNPGDGFWVNASTVVFGGYLTGKPFSLGESNLLAGWNLVATGDDISPQTFNTIVGNVTSLWAWDNTNRAWHFYALALEANGTLAAYIQGKGYKDFVALTLGNELGFWVNYAGPLSSLALFAGSMGGPGNSDGTGGAVSFNSPQSVATDGAGNVYVADTYNNSIRKITPAGVVTTLASGFNYPTGVAADSAGNVYVSDTNNNAIRKITPDGAVTTLAGAGYSGSADGTGTAATFYGPTGLAVDSNGNVFVADSYNKTIRKITPAGVVSTLAGFHDGYSYYSVISVDGTGVAARFGSPGAVAIDSSGNLYVTDNRLIRKITPAGVVTTLAGRACEYGCYADGTGSAAGFSEPSGVATDAADNVYVTDFNTVRKITPAGVVTTFAGAVYARSGTDGTGTSASFVSTVGIATDSGGNIYVADRFNNNIRKITPDAAVTTFAGLGGGPGPDDGLGTQARFWNPTGIATDSTGNIYVADTCNNLIRRIGSAGQVTTFAGVVWVMKGVAGYADGTGGQVKFDSPNGVAVDLAGNVYVGDYGNSTIRKITPDGVVSTVAGIGYTTGSTDGTATAATFNHPAGVATDSSNNIYVADSGNNTIRKITPTGVVTTLAGTAGVIGHADGTGAAASFHDPTGIAIDITGNIYVVDTFNQVVRKITPAGVVTTLAGTTGVTGSVDSSGTAASFYNPTGVTTDSTGNVYVADSGNNTIRKITPAGVVTTVVGVAGELGFSAGALPGVLWHPSVLAFSGRTLCITTKNGVAVVRDVP